MTLEARFRDKFVREGDDDCWLWSGATTREGYGSIYVSREMGARLATHVALELAGLPRPSKKHHALHRCDTPGCVNPGHLWWGTHAENMSDMRAKGRMDISGFEKFWRTPGQARRKFSCKRGHILAGPNLYVSPQGRRQCAVCMKARKRARLFDEPTPKPIQTNIFDGDAA